MTQREHKGCTADITGFCHVEQDFMLVELHRTRQTLQNKIVCLMHGIDIDIRVRPAAFFNHFTNARRHFIHDKSHDLHAVHVLILKRADIFLGIDRLDISHPAFAWHSLSTRWCIETF